MTDFKTAYTRTRSPYLTVGDSKTKQSFKQECDVNTLLKKYRKTGLLEHVNMYQGRYENLSDPVDYQTALNLVLSATAAFDSLPSQVRKQFSNSPHEFLTFVNNPENESAMRDLGLLPPEIVPDVTPPVLDPVEPEPEA